MYVLTSFQVTKSHAVHTALWVLRGHIECAAFILGAVHLRACNCHTSAILLALICSGALGCILTSNVHAILSYFRY